MTHPRITLEPSDTGRGWYWSFSLAGVVQSSGHESSHAVARDKGHAAYQQWNLSLKTETNDPGDNDTFTS